MTTTMIAKLVVFMAGAFVTMTGLGTALVGNAVDTQGFPLRSKLAFTVGALLIVVGVGIATLALSR
jgi:sulfite exporter TauE/SafE